MQRASGKNTKGAKYVWSILLVAVLILALFNRFNNRTASTTTKQLSNRNRQSSIANHQSSRVDHREKGFRHNTIYYTRHAQCRMECRHIDEQEVKEILEEGTINYSKSETNATQCPKYALEGITHDKQHVRIIVGDCASQASIITVIDLDHDYACNCPGDKGQ